MNRITVLFLLLILSCAHVAAGQVFPGQAPASGQQRDPATGLPPGMALPAVPDTAVIRLVLPEGQEPPLGLAVRPDSVTVGGNAILRLVFPAGRVPGDPETFRETAGFSQDWIEWNPGLGPARAAGDTLLLPVKIFQVNPFRIQVDSLLSRVVTVISRVKGLQETAAIRDPRRWGWNFLILVAGALMLAILFLLAWWAWTARKVATEKLPDWEVPPPAWLQSSIELKALMDEGLLERGEARRFLDRLAGICRRYIAGRFRVPASEMTAPEIAAACHSAGYPAGTTAGFTDLLREIDRSRYDPDRLLPGDCRRCGREFLAGMSEVRVMPRQTPVPPALLLEAGRAWTYLSGQLAKADPGRPEQVFAPGPVQEGE